MKPVQIYLMSELGQETKRKRKTGQRGPRNICPMCDKTFCDQSTALRHLKHVHAPPISCQYCLKNIKVGGRPDVLRNHLVRCPNFIKAFPEDAYEQAKIQGRLIYDNVKKLRNKVFQPHHLELQDSGYFDIASQVPQYYFVGPYDYGGQSSSMYNSSFLPQELYSPISLSIEDLNDE